MEWFHELVSRLTYSVNFQHPYALIAIFGLGALTDIGFPFPFVLETFLFFASYNVGPLSLPVLLTLAMLVSGREVGSAGFYSISRLLGPRLLVWLGKRVKRLSRNVERFRERLERHTILGVVVVRLTPGLLQVPSLIAGTMKLSYPRFAAGVAIGGIIYDFGLVVLGYFAKLLSARLGGYFEIYVLVGFGVVIIGAWVYMFIRFR